jgi:PKD repeat protein
MLVSPNMRIMKGIWPILALVCWAPQAAQAQFNYTTTNGAITVTGYTGPGGSVAVPASINNLTVTSIGDEAFAGGVSITNLSVPDSVNNIGQGAFTECGGLASITLGTNVTSVPTTAFSYCTNLSSVTLLGNVTDVGEDAFLDCYKLADFTIPDTVTSIGDFAFDTCTGLTNVIIPGSVTNLGVAAFRLCSSLTAINVAANNPNYASLAGVVFNQSETALVQYPCGRAGPYTIPDAVTNIVDQAFEGSGAITSVTFGSNVVSIGDYAFFGCPSLTNVSLSASVTNLGLDPFADCGNLAAINVATNNTYYTSIGGVVFNLDETVLVDFPGGTTGFYIVPSTVTSIADSAFYACEGVVNVTIPNSVTNIGEAAFDNCGSLTNITIGSGVVSVGSMAFAFDGDLSSVFFAGNAPSGDSTVFFPPSPATVYYLSGASGWSSTFGGVPAKELNPNMVQTTFAATPTAGQAPLTVNFMASSTDNAGNAITSWQWNFGDGSTSTAQNPSHTYTNLGIFAVGFQATNRLANSVPGVGPLSIAVTFAPVSSGIVINGGFETGDFTGWTLAGNAGLVNGVTNSSFTPSGADYVHAGNYGAVLGEYGFAATLSQALSTSAGQRYVLSFWLENPTNLPTEIFKANWNGSTIFALTNPPAFTWSNFTFSVAASNAGTTLQFAAETDQNYFGLDDISVVPVFAAPVVGSVKVSGSNLLLTGNNGVAGTAWYALMSTNLNAPLNLWTQITTNVLGSTGNFTLTIPNAVNSTVSQRYYILRSSSSQ